MLWIAFRFFIFVLQTQLWKEMKSVELCCELLSDFLSLFFKHNQWSRPRPPEPVVTCFQIFYLCSSNTTHYITLYKQSRCELLSDFLSLFFKHNSRRSISKADRLWIAFRFFIFVLQTQLSDRGEIFGPVVNCFQIFYLCSSNTTYFENENHLAGLWIAFRFFIFVLQTQRGHHTQVDYRSCELLSDFLSLFFKHNIVF